MIPGFNIPAFWVFSSTTTRIFVENIEIVTKNNLGKLAVGQAFYAEPLLPVIPQVVGGLVQL